MSAAPDDVSTAGLVSIRREGPDHVLEARTWLPGQTREQVFPVFADAFNLETLTPGWLQFRVVTRPPIEIQRGTLIDYRLRVRGVPIRWRSLISEWHPPHFFVDTQVAGPYALWRHEHRLAETPGGVMAADRVVYRTRGGRLVHAIAAPALANRDLRRIFEYRLWALRSLLLPGGVV